MPDTGEFGRIKRSFHAILIISGIVCEQAGLRHYQLGSDERYTALGLLLVIVVTSAGVLYREGAKLLFQRLTGSCKKLRCIWVADRFRFTLRVILRSDKQKGFKLLPRRWVVEHTFAWLNHYRRLSNDYEILPETAETFVYLAMTRLMLRRLAA